MKRITVLVVLAVILGFCKHSFCDELRCFFDVPQQSEMRQALTKLAILNEVDIKFDSFEVEKDLLTNDTLVNKTLVTPDEIKEKNDDIKFETYESDREIFVVKFDGPLETLQSINSHLEKIINDYNEGGQKIIDGNLIIEIDRGKIDWVCKSKKENKVP